MDAETETTSTDDYPELTSDDLQNLQKVEFTWYPIHSIKRKIRVRSLSEAESAKFEQQQMTKRGTINKAAVLESRRNYLRLCIVDKDGNPNFKADEFVGRIKPIEEMYRVCSGHNGLTEQEAEALVGN